MSFFFAASTTFSASIMSHRQEHNPQIHTIGRRQLRHMQAVLLGPDVRVVEEGAVMAKGHVVEAEDRFVKEADDEERPWMTSMLEGKEGTH
jgi:hypothetical protein